MDLRMAEAAVSSLLDNLQDLLSNEMDLLSGRESEFEQLQNELELVKALFKNWANSGKTLPRFERDIVREVVYEVEDIIDAHLIDSATFRSQKNLTALREETIRPLFHSLTSAPQKPTTRQHQRVPSLREDNLVGFADQADTLIKYLLEETEELDVISIIGMSGSGKTTLAWKIYRDDRIQSYSPYLIWVYVYESYSTRDVLVAIVKKFTLEDMSELPDALLADIVRNNLEKQRFLMIIDGVLTTQDWRVIEAALPKTNRLGKVLLTTRYDRVAREASRSREPHQLRLLTFDESWELLQLEVFGRNNHCPPALKGLGKHIASQCQGLPHAVVAMAGILVENRSDRNEFWKIVSSRVSKYLQNDRQKRTKNIISLSYGKLPHHLRDCFLYLGMFPADTEIPVWKLTRLWIAEGFIQQDPRKSLEEVAGGYLNDLVARNLVMVGKTKANGDVKTCLVHDLIRDFCLKEAESADNNLFREVKMTRKDVFYPAISEIEKCRRLCIHSNVMEFVSKSPKGPKVRSFLCFSRDPIHAETAVPIPKAFDLLRVVDVIHVNPIKSPKFPRQLTKLIHLRYIALSGNQFKALPGAVSKLWNLQTIKIDTTSRQFKIKADIWRLMQLRHLKTKAAIVLNKEAKGKGGENLQTLSRLSTDSLTDDICDRAFNLKSLGVRGNLNTLMHTTCLTRLDRLEKLKLVHDAFPLRASENILSRLLDQRAFPPNLRILELSFTLLEWKHISILGTLPRIKMLKLKANAFVGWLWKVGVGGFPSLEALQIEQTDLIVWRASKDSFPRLKCLVLKNCEKLLEIPHVLVKSLQVVDIERVKKSVVNSARRIEEEVQARPGARRGEFQLKISPGNQSL